MSIHKLLSVMFCKYFLPMKILLLKTLSMWFAYPYFSWCLFDEHKFVILMKHSFALQIILALLSMSSLRNQCLTLNHKK